MLIANMPRIGSRKERNPTTASKQPKAVNQPQPRTPKRRSSKELTSFVMPENNSHMPKMKGSVKVVKARLKRRNRDKITAATPSAKNHPAPNSSPCPLTEIIISAMPDACYSRRDLRNADIYRCCLRPNGLKSLSRNRRCSIHPHPLSYSFAHCWAA